MSASIKLPEKLKSWKIITRLSDEKSNELYKVSKKDYDGTVIPAVLRYVSISKEDYTIENTDFINDEAAFLKAIAQSGECFNYLDIYVENNPAKKKIEFFIITEDLKTLSELMKSKNFDEDEIIDFGIQMSAILEKLENNNIYHGNINPDEIYVTFDGKYKLGGFSDFESKISDMSFIAPEIYSKKDADFTTDIYSLGLIMYYMCNGFALPFETDGVSKNDAINKRFDGGAVTAPKNGSEKLKSVIIIACQPNNENRWKNAANIKNALTSIKNEAYIAKENENLVIPESTDFDGNVFEEYEYEGFDNAAKSAAEVFPVTGAILEEENSDEQEKPEETVNENTDNSENEALQESSASESNEKSVEAENESEFETEDETEFAEETVKTESSELKEAPINNLEKENSPVDIYSGKNLLADDGGEFEIDNRVFETYEAKKTDKTFRQHAMEKDYGDYFEDDETVKEKANESNILNFDKEDEEEVNIFEDDETENTPSENSAKNKKNGVIIAVSVIIMLAALGFVAYCILGGLDKKPANNDNTTDAAVTEAFTTIQSTTAEATTVPSATAEPTTVINAEKEVLSVADCGYGFSYAKKLLENEGFVVQEGERRYSNDWPAGYVLSQTPQGGAFAKAGTVVTLDVSLGPEEETTAAPIESHPKKPDSPSSASGSNSYLLSNSASAYLNKADVSALSDSNLTLALNEIYARRGRIFKDAYLSSYFKTKSWYTPKYTSDEFSKNVTFNSYEQKNLQLLIDEQKSRGLR